MKTFIMHAYTTLTHLFREKKENELLVSIIFSSVKYVLNIRTFCIDDIEFIRHWLDTDACRRFWDADNSRDHLLQTYSGIMHSPHTVSMILSLNETPVCLIDAYHVQHDELGNYVEATAKDYGIHFLMAPAKIPLRHLSACCMQQCLRFLFSFDDVETIYGEPDSYNTKANALVVKAGFRFLAQQLFSYKTANIYTCRRPDFKQQLLYMPTPCYAY